MSVIESTDNDNITFNLASDLVKNTNISLFLTGKAGTGKTTFLKHIQNTCRDTAGGRRWSLGTTRACTSGNSRVSLCRLVKTAVRAWRS